MERIKMRKIIFGIITSLVLMLALACQSSELTSAKMYLQEKNLESAEEWFLKAMALEIEAKNAEIPYRLARYVYAVQKKYAEMTTMLDKAIAINADQLVDGAMIRDLVLNTRQLEWQSNYKRGAAIYNSFLDGLTQGQPISEEQRGQVQEAMKFFSLAIMIWPEEGATYPNLVYCFRQLGDKEGETQALQKALEMDPENGTIQMLAGEVQAAADNLTAAIEYFERAYTLSPDNMPIMQRLTSSYLAAGNSVSALEILEQTQKLAPGDPNISFNIGAVYQNIGNDALILGQDLYNKAVTGEKVLSTVLEEALVQFKQAQNAYSEALYFLDNTLGMNPDDLSAEQALSAIKMRKKSLDKFQRKSEDILRNAK